MDPLTTPNLLDLPHLAELAALPVSVVRYYRDRFILFVPSVRIGRVILHPPEAVDVMLAIRDLAASGKDARAIEAALDELYPVTVVNAQQVEPAGLPAGHAAALYAVASAFDERGARLESEIAELRKDVSAITSLPTLADIERLHPALEAAVGELGDLGHVAVTIDGLHAQLAQLASREQLEWIGDVVAAAALRPPQSAMDAAIERRLGELQSELHKAQGRDEIATRAAMERLTEQLTGQMTRRDQEIQRAFKTLVAALRQEITVMHTGIAELKHSVNAISETSIAQGAHAHGVHADATWAAGNGSWDAGPEATRAQDAADRSRAPRRLGQPLKANGAPHSEEDLAQGLA